MHHMLLQVRKLLICDNYAKYIYNIKYNSFYKNLQLPIKITSIFKQFNFEGDKVIILYIKYFSNSNINHYFPFYNSYKIKIFNDFCLYSHYGEYSTLLCG